MLLLVAVYPGEIKMIDYLILKAGHLEFDEIFTMACFSGQLEVIEH